MINATNDGPVEEFGPISDSQWTYIVHLIDGSVFDEMQRMFLHLQLTDLTQEHVQEFIDHLKDNQLNPVTHRGNHSATEVNRHLRKTCKR